MQFISRKQRNYSTRALGNHNAVGRGEDFRTYRKTDNRFYWLSSDQINDANLNDFVGWVNHRTPAMMQGTIKIANAIKLLIMANPPSGALQNCAPTG